jgi:excisionase family DNA binding protein
MTKHQGNPGRPPADPAQQEKKDMATEIIDREEEILTSREAQEFLKIGRTKLWELTKSKQLPAYRVGSGRTSSLRYKKSELLAWLERNRVQA